MKITSSQLVFNVLVRADKVNFTLSKEEAVVNVLEICGTLNKNYHIGRLFF